MQDTREGESLARGHLLARVLSCVHFSLPVRATPEGPDVIPVLVCAPDSSHGAPHEPKAMRQTTVPLRCK